MSFFFRGNMNVKCTLDCSPVMISGIKEGSSQQNSALRP